jgi:hypothetical protein
MGEDEAEEEEGRSGSAMMRRESIHVGGLCSRRASVINHEPGL